MNTQRRSSDGALDRACMNGAARIGATPHAVAMALQGPSGMDVLPLEIATSYRARTRGCLAGTPKPRPPRGIARLLRGRPRGVSRLRRARPPERRHQGA